MTTKKQHAAGQAANQSETLNEVQHTDQKAQAKTGHAKRRRYSINDVLRLMKALDEAKQALEASQEQYTVSIPSLKHSTSRNG